MRRAVALAALLVGLAGPALAQSTTSAAAVGSRESLDYLVGRWTASARDPQTGQVDVADYRIERTAGGAWLTGAAASADGALASRDVWGRDPLSGEIIRVIFDKSGAFGTVRSPGWRGDTLVLEGEVRSGGGTIRVRETITRRGPDRFDAVWEAFRDGQWAPYSVETVTRRT